MKVIFLDIDGVLNSVYDCTYHQDQHMKINDPCIGIFERPMKLLNELVENTGAVVVVSSTWRLNGYEKVKQQLCDAGFKWYVHDITPHFPSTFRGLEIKDWLERHDNVTHYVILDDDDDMLQSQLPSFVQCDNYIGLTPNVTYKAEKILKGEPNVR